MKCILDIEIDTLLLLMITFKPVRTNQGLELSTKRNLGARLNNFVLFAIKTKTCFLLNVNIVHVLTAGTNG